MKNSEMAVLFGMMMKAYPNAKMFEGGLEPLGLTIKFWAEELYDVDFWTGRVAVSRAIRICKYPPSIAEIKEQADAVQADVKCIVNDAKSLIRAGTFCFGTTAEYYASLAPENRIRQAIDAIGGVKKLEDPSGQMWEWAAFESACISLIKAQEMLPGGTTALPEHRKE